MVENVNLVELKETRMQKRVRKYEDTFIEFGFTYVVEGDIEKPQCVMCCAFRRKHETEQIAAAP